MTIEQKAEAYDKVLEKAKSWHIDAQIDFKKSLENLFPELKETDDERIRKMLIKFFGNGAFCDRYTYGISDKDIVAWLEKQNHDGKKWIYEDVYSKEKEQLIQDGIDEVLENPQNYGLKEQSNPDINPSEFDLHLNKLLNQFETLPKEELASSLSFYLNVVQNDGTYKPNKKSIWKHWKDGICGNGEGKPIFLIKNYNTYSISSCLSSECDYIELSELDNLMFETQGKQKPVDYENANIQQKDFAPQEDVPRYSIGDVLCDKSCTTLNKEAQHNFEITDIRDGMYICDKWSIPISQQDEFELVSKRIEPKFKVGDWVVFNNNHNTVYQVEKIENYRYILRHFLGGSLTLSFNHEDILSLWTLQDAKEGDVLAFYSEYKGNKMVQVGIIEKYVGKRGGCSNTFKIYGGVNWDNHLQIGDYMGCSDIQPATKEQRDTLFTKMKEADYEWDADKKELKEIEQSKLTEFEEAIKNMMDDYRNAIDDYETTVEEVKEHAAYLLSLIPCKYAEWSEEDKEMLEKIDTDLYLYEGKVRYGRNKEGADTIKKHREWFKIFINKVHSKQEWSEEDEKMVDNILTATRYPFDLYQPMYNWLKALKQRIRG